MFMLMSLRSKVTAALRWGLHLLGEDAEARIRDLTCKVDGLHAANDLLTASAEAERRKTRELRAMLADKAAVLQEIARLRDLLTPRQITPRQITPQGDNMVLWWDGTIWTALSARALGALDIWLPQPPPPDERQFHTAEAGLSDLKRRLGLRCEHGAKRGACAAEGCSFKPPGAAR